MEMKDKIKMLREQHGLTLEDVGNVVGVGKSTVRKWETGDIANMRRDKIEKLAEALHTTPAFLMGWENDDTPALRNENSAPVLSDEALVIAAAYDRADDRARQVVDLTLEPYMEKSAKSKIG